MKLIDMLVNELPKRGGWPEGVEEIWQDYDGLIRPGMWGWFHHELSEDHRPQHHDAKVKINRKQYEAAIASQQPVWNGEGLPPVGVECELTPHNNRWGFSGSSPYRGAVIAYDGEDFWFKDSSNVNTVSRTDKVNFRPIRTEAERKREAEVDELIDAITLTLTDIYASQRFMDAIAAGKIPGIRLSDD